MQRTYGGITAEKQTAQPLSQPTHTYHVSAPHGLIRRCDPLRRNSARRGMLNPIISRFKGTRGGRATFSLLSHVALGSSQSLDWGVGAKMEEEYWGEKRTTTTRDRCLRLFPGRSLPLSRLPASSRKNPPFTPSGQLLAAVAIT
uniref:Uncharacterized protein n=1 Tax=Bursaphelenchus xylophilus TaxID=6326 RepID=A0A1I7RPR2_BURXY